MYKIKKDRIAFRIMGIMFFGIGIYILSLSLSVMEGIIYSLIHAKDLLPDYFLNNMPLIFLNMLFLVMFLFGILFLGLGWCGLTADGELTPKHKIKHSQTKILTTNQEE